MLAKNTKNKIAISLLIIFYLIGISGITIPIHEDFILLTPFNLLISMGLILWVDNSNKKTLWLLLSICFSWGFFIELAGVQTGKIFGVYQYGEVLGPKIWETPPMIGLNWAMLVYASCCVSNILLKNSNIILKTILASALMTGLDILIEPVAIRYGFWQWAEVTVPLQNYVAWFLIALPLNYLFLLKLPGLTNKVAVALFILQVLFFGILGIL